MIGSCFASSELSDNFTPSVTLVILSAGISNTLALMPRGHSTGDENFLHVAAVVGFHAVDLTDLGPVRAKHGCADRHLTCGDRRVARLPGAFQRPGLRG